MKHLEQLSSRRDKWEAALLGCRTLFFSLLGVGWGFPEETVRKLQDSEGKGKTKEALTVDDLAAPSVVFLSVELT